MLINNTDQARQLILYDGMGIKNTKITPTDIDYMVEFRQRALIIGEVKYKNVFIDRNNQPLKYGQRKCLTELIDNAAKAGKEAILFILIHQTLLPKDIYIKKALVAWTYYKKEWKELNYKITLKKMQKQFLKKKGGL